MEKEKRKINTGLILTINIILLIISFFVYKYIFEVEKLKKTYAEETAQFIENNENPVFKIGQIILYSSANAIDNSNGDLKDIDISQFTDMEIYIDNLVKSEEITAENTINEMYINNIKIESQSDKGEKIFNYKNPQNCGKYVELSNWEADGILFNITRTNEENKTANYDHNIFYTDCSNPISLGYINKNILKGCEVSKEVGTITFDGTILKSGLAGVNNSAVIGTAGNSLVKTLFEKLERSAGRTVTHNRTHNQTLHKAISILQGKCCSRGATCICSHFRASTKGSAV